MSEREPIKLELNPRTLALIIAVLVGSGGVGGGLSLASNPKDEVAQLVHSVDRLEEQVERVYKWQENQDARMRAFWERTWPGASHKLEDLDRRVQKLESVE